MKKETLSQRLLACCKTLESEFALIPEVRRQELAELGGYLARKRQAGADAALIVICTHNSRRSHMGQLWLAAAAAYYGQEGISTHSGGTEATAFDARAVAALERAGFHFSKDDDTANPCYTTRLGEGLTGIRLFSKRYDDPANPQQGFAAVLVCSDADEACPFLPGADQRFAIPYEDPKAADGTPGEAAVYDARCRQIGREMLFAIRAAAHLPPHLPA